MFRIKTLEPKRRYSIGGDSRRGRVNRGEASRGEARQGEARRVDGDGEARQMQPRRVLGVVVVVVAGSPGRVMLLTFQTSFCQLV